MITAEEWNDFVRLYVSSEESLPHKEDFRVSHPFGKQKREEIDKKLDVSYGACRALASYAGRGCVGLNEQMREERWLVADKAIQVYKDLVHRGLDELPEYNNEICYRWSNLPEEGFEYLKKYVGKVILIPQFWSTSKWNKSEESMFFKIQTSNSSNARDIEEVVNKPSEKEILFKPNTRFKILSCYEDRIHLEEVDQKEYDLALYYRFWEENPYSPRVLRKLFPEYNIENKI